MKQTDRSDLASMGVLGMLSGVVAWGLMMLIDHSYLSTIKGSDEIGIFEVRVLPGLVFGLVIGFLWHRRGRVSHLGVLGYAIASSVAHLAAFEFALHTFDRWPGFTENLALALSGIIAGLIGCCILGTAVVFLLRVPFRSALGVPVLVGAALGVLLPLINLSGDRMGLGWLLFYVLWQGGYAASSARLVPSSMAMAPGPR
jgi:hypothetical protein